MAAEICKQVLELTKARQLPVSPQDAQLVAEYEKYVKDEEQSAIAKENRRKAKREEKERERLGVVA